MRICVNNNLLDTNDDAIVGGNSHRMKSTMYVSKRAMHVSKRVIALAGLALVSLAASSAFAHHSFAMFDYQKTVVLDGTVKEFQWTNPHSWLQLVVRDASGKDVEWSIEGGSLNALSRLGWKRTSLKPGDKAAVAFHPLKDGTPGGSLLYVTVNGVRIGETPP